MKFKKMNVNMEIETTKGLLVLESSEYFQIEDSRKNAPVVINKNGIQKIEDFFGATYVEPVINQVWNSSSNFNLVVTVGLKFEDEIIYGIGSGNNLSLSNVIAQAYPAEMAVKRAKAVAALELLRKNYSGSDRLPLLYSSFDEFNTEEAVNTTVEIVAEKPASAATPVVAETSKMETVKTDIPKADKAPAVAPEETKKVTSVTEETPTTSKEKVTSATEETKPTLVENTQTETSVNSATSETTAPAAEGYIEDFVLTTSRYRTGITIKELLEKDPSYYKWLATSTATGRYIAYQEKVIEHMKKFDVKLA